MCICYCLLMLTINTGTDEKFLGRKLVFLYPFCVAATVLGIFTYII